MTDDYDQFTKRMTSFDMTLGDEAPIEHAEDPADSFLKHYGVKGMKWGVRRSERQLAKANARREASSEDSRSAQDSQATIKKGSVDSLSNKELQTLVTRMNLEQQFSTLNDKANTKTKSAGRKFAEDIARDLAKETVKSAIKNTAGVRIQGTMEKQLNKGIDKGVNKAKKARARTRR